jgi:hypothetical protein
VTHQSPARLRVFVIAVAGRSADANDVAVAIEAIRAGRAPRLTVGGGVQGDRLVLEGGTVPQETALVELRGFARASEEPHTAGDLQPPRALRRALADARMSASDIGYACAFELGSSQQARARAALERGFGRYAATIELEVAEDPLIRCIGAITGSGGSVDGAIALIITPGGGSIALAFARP